MSYKLDYENLMKHVKKLEKHDGLIPTVLMSYMDVDKYYKNLRKQKDYDKITRDIHNRRNKLMYMDISEQLLFEEKELMDFIKDNPQYMDMIIDG